MKSNHPEHEVQQNGHAITRTVERTGGYTRIHRETDRQIGWIKYIPMNQIHPNHTLSLSGVQSYKQEVLTWLVGTPGVKARPDYPLNPQGVLYNVHINVRVNVSFVIYKIRNKHITYGAHNNSYNREYSNSGDMSCAPLLSWLENSSKRSCKQCVNNNV